MKVWPFFCHHYQVYSQNTRISVDHYWCLFKTFLIHQNSKTEPVTFSFRKLHSIVYLQIQCLQGVKAYSEKIFVFKIWKETMLVLKQTIHQQKALDLSFNLIPWNGRGIIRRAPRPLAAKSIFCWILWPRNGFLTSCLLWDL